MKRYGLYGVIGRDFLTYRGRILWHHDCAELEFLCPGSRLGTVTVRELPPDIPPDQCLPIREHPAMQSVRWPLVKADFRCTAVV